jgi:hypothetical protein
VNTLAPDAGVTGFCGGSATPQGQVYLLAGGPRNVVVQPQAICHRTRLLIMTGTSDMERPVN